MFKISNKGTCDLLYLIFSSYIESRIVTTNWKMISVVPIYKRNEKRTVKNY